MVHVEVISSEVTPEDLWANITERIERWLLFPSFFRMREHAPDDLHELLCQISEVPNTYTLHVNFEDKAGSRGTPRILILVTPRSLGLLDEFVRNTYFLQ
jgi:hypothetical protein